MTDFNIEEVVPFDQTTIQIQDGDASLTLDYANARNFHEGDSWWGVAVGFRAMQAAAPLLSEEKLWRRDALTVVSAHPGPGVRDAIDFVTGAVQQNRYHLTPEQQGRKTCGRDMKFQWWVSDGAATTIIKLHADFVPEEFFELLDKILQDSNDDDDRQKFDALKLELETKIWQHSLGAVFHAERLPLELEKVIEHNL